MVTGNLDTHVYIFMYANLKDPVTIKYLYVNFKVS